MKVLFLNPAFGHGFCKSARWFAKSRGRVQRHPDYLCQAIAVLEEVGHECRFIDGAARDLSPEETLAGVVAFQPEMTVIQATTPSIYSDLGYARMCKEAVGDGLLTVMVGAHVSAEPDYTLHKSEGCLDVVARGEYDYTLRDLAAGRSISEVEAVSYVADGRVVHNPARPFIENLDELPFPAWHHIDPYDYPDAGKLYPFITLLGGRGCGGRCTFCLFPQVMYGQRYRARSPERVVDEMAYDLRLFPFLEEIMFEDDTLTLRPHLPRLRAICEEILRRGIKIPWSANARADLRDIQTLRLMKRAGCRMLCVGFEFGNQQILNKVRKGIQLEHMREFAELAREAGIRVHGCFMIGGPGETRETAYQTIAFARRLPIDTAQFSGVCAYPGTEYYDWARENGYLVPQDWPQWVDENLEQRAIINLPQLSVDEINELVDQGLREFYLRPRQMWRMLRNIRSWADVKAKWHGLMSFADYFGRS
jgi:radical SAM superfamily enzyme YgiQ (UPF0313 family)